MVSKSDLISKYNKGMTVAILSHSLMNSNTYKLLLEIGFNILFKKSVETDEFVLMSPSDLHLFYDVL